MTRSFSPRDRGPRSRGVNLRALHLPPGIRPPKRLRFLGIVEKSREGRGILLKLASGSLIRFRTTVFPARGVARRLIEESLSGKRSLSRSNQFPRTGINDAAAYLSRARSSVAPLSRDYGILARYEFFQRLTTCPLSAISRSSRALDSSISVGLRETNGGERFINTFPARIVHFRRAGLVRLRVSKLVLRDR